MKATWTKNQYGGWSLIIGDSTYVTMYRDHQTGKYDSYINGTFHSPQGPSVHPGPLLDAQVAATRFLLTDQEEIVAALREYLAQKKEPPQ